MSYEKLLNNLKKSSENKEAKTPASDSKKINILEIKKEGSYRLRLLPSLRDADDVPFVKVEIHLGFVHPNYGKIVPLLCLGPKECPLCAYHRGKQKEKAKDEWKYKSNNRYIYYALDEEGNIVMLSLNYYVHEAIRQKMMAQLKMKVNIMDLLDGRWIEVVVRKINDKTTYVVAVDVESHKVSRNIREKYENLKPLEEVYDQKTKEDLKKIAKGEKLEIKNKKTNKPAETTDNNSEEIDSSKFKSMEQRLDKSSSSKVNPEDLKFDSDMVDNIDEDVVSSAEDDDSGISNMKRLDDILNRGSSDGDFN